MATWWVQNFTIALRLVSVLSWVFIPLISSIVLLRDIMLYHFPWQEKIVNGCGHSVLFWILLGKYGLDMLVGQSRYFSHTVSLFLRSWNFETALCKIDVCGIALKDRVGLGLLSVLGTSNKVLAFLYQVPDLGGLAPAVVLRNNLCLGLLQKLLVFQHRRDASLTKKRSLFRFIHVLPGYEQAGTTLQCLLKDLAVVFWWPSDCLTQSGNIRNDRQITCFLPVCIRLLH